ncbi:HNH endonuclease [Enterococcus diestrammenae]|uniref:HNH nuclease domain-containing protein n=1 Tax=Enterococcus diestrammenae TaxID=1155073 RepID=A0ABV0EYW3_9ENTE|nr:hypothetical protein [Enterococcus diestrammenae]KAF1294789.1 hypothetical protein BAU18_03550 [Enterococcus diestrammenae]
MNQILNLNTERWIPGYEYKYYANWNGQIFRVFKNGKKRELKGYVKGNLYCVKLSDGTRYREFPFQRVVWMTFKGPIPDGYFVVRKTKIKTLNSMQNLRLRSFAQHGKKTGGLASSKEVILMDEDGSILDSWISARKAAKDLFVSYQTVMDICNGKIKGKPIVNVRWARKNEAY